MKKLTIGGVIVAEFTDKQVSLLKGKRMKLSGKFKTKTMNSFDDFLYYCDIDTTQNHLNKLDDMVIKDLALELQ